MEERVKEIKKYYDSNKSVRENKKILKENNVSFGDDEDALLLYLAIYEIDEKED